FFSRPELQFTLNSLPTQQPPQHEGFLQAIRGVKPMPERKSDQMTHLKCPGKRQVRGLFISGVRNGNETREKALSPPQPCKSQQDGRQGEHDHRLDERPPISRTKPQEVTQLFQKQPPRARSRAGFRSTPAYLVAGCRPRHRIPLTRSQRPPRPNRKS